MKKILSSKVYFYIISSLLCFSFITTITILIFEFNNYYLINPAPANVSFYLDLILGLLLLLSAKARKAVKKVLFSFTVLALGAVIIISGYFSMLEFENDRDIKNYYISPDGKHKIVVFENGFIEAYYTAYPVKFNIFYKKNNIDSVSRADFWGGAGQEVVWETDSATVYIIFNAKESKNNNDSIKVYYS